MEEPPEGATLKIFVPAIRLDRSSPAPLARQIRQQVQDSLRAGEAPPGSRLPSTRMLAQLLGVSRNTVAAAFEELAADGLIRSERGSGMRIVAPHGRTIRAILRDAQFPARTAVVLDPDGNPVSLNAS